MFRRFLAVLVIFGCFLATMTLAHGDDAANPANAALQRARNLIASGQPMDAVILILEEGKTLPEDGSLAYDMLALGQTFKFVYDNLLTTLERRQLLEEHLIQGTSIVEKTLWLFCFPGFDGLAEEVQSTALTLYDEVLASKHVLAKGACLALAIYIQLGWGADAKAADCLNEICVLESGRAKPLTREILGSALHGMSDEPDRLMAFINGTGWSKEMKRIIDHSNFCNTLQRLHGANSATDHDLTVSILLDATSKEKDARERYFMIKMFDDDDRQRSDVRKALFAIARETRDSPDVTLARLRLLKDTTNNEAFNEASELTALLQQQEQFPTISDMKLETETAKALEQYTKKLVEKGRGQEATDVYEKIKKRYPNSQLSVKFKEHLTKR